MMLANKPSEINEEEGRPVYDPDTGEGSVAVEFEPQEYFCEL